MQCIGGFIVDTSTPKNKVKCPYTECRQLMCCKCKKPVSLCVVMLTEYGMVIY